MKRRTDPSGAAKKGNELVDVCDSSTDGGETGVMLKENNTLKTLDLRKCKPRPEGLVEVFKSVQENTKLESLYLSENTIDDMSASHLGMMLKENNTLKKLYLRNCGLQPEGLVQVFRSVQVNAKLEILILVHNTIDDLSASHLGVMLKENNTLKKLDLSMCKLQPEGLVKVFKGVQVNTTLETLNLSWNTVDVMSASHLGVMLKENSTLKELVLWRCRLQPEGLVEMFKAVQVNTKLETLELYKNTIDDMSASHLANALKDNTALSKLHLGECGLGDEGMSVLCGGLRLSKLKDLNVRTNPFGVQGAQCLADVLKVNPTLEVLVMHECDEIGDDGVQYLIDAMLCNTTLLTMVLPEPFGHLIPEELNSRMILFFK